MGSSFSVFLLRMVLVVFKSSSICKHEGGKKLFDEEKVEFWK